MRSGRFLIAGHFGEPDWWRREVKKRFSSLAVPYVFWNIFYWLFATGLWAIGLSVGVAFGTFELLSFGISPVSLPYFTYLWFVRCLIVFSCAGPVFALLRFRWSGLVFPAFFVLEAISQDSFLATPNPTYT